MRKIAIIIMIALSISACKKQKIQKCIIGNWRLESTNINILIKDYEKYGKDDIGGDPMNNIIYIDNSNNIIRARELAGYVKCNGNNATLYYTNSIPMNLIRLY